MFLMELYFSGLLKFQGNVAFLADSDYWYFVCPNDACRDYGILAENIETDGEMTFQCQTVPESDITIYILRLEVET